MTQSKAKPFIFLLVLISLIFNAEIKVHASHAVGGDISYTCLGSNMYRYRLSLYRDCSGSAMLSTQVLNISSATCGITFSTTLTLLPGYPVEVSPLCPSSLSLSTCRGGSLPGIEQYIYEGTVTMPDTCADWVLSWTLCCRNPDITTITSPGAVSMTLKSTLNNRIVPCNSSPTFSTLPIPYICVGQPYVYNHGATDIDGDSLYYSLTPALNGSVSVAVPYITGSGYSYLNPLTCSGPFAIDSSNGNISFTPSIVQVGVVAVLVQEFRDGVLIGSIMRDIQVRVITCTNESPALDTIRNDVGGIKLSPYTMMICAGDSLSFQIFASDSDALDTLTMTSNILAAIPGATFTASPRDRSPVFGIFSWRPTTADLGAHFMVVSAADNACPIISTTVRAFEIDVVGVEISTPDSVFTCYPPGSSVELAAAGSADTFSWFVLSGDSASISCFSCNPVSVSPVRTTTYVVVGVTPAGCKDRDTITVSVYPNFVLSVSHDTTVCNGSPVRLSATADLAGSYTYQWFPAIGLSSDTVSNPIATPTDSTYYLVHMTNRGGCDNWASVAVNIVNAGEFTQTKKICAGDGFTVGSHVYTMPGVYRDTFPTRLLICDSVMVTTITFDTAMAFISKPNDTILCLGKSMNLTEVMRYDTIVRYDTTDRCDTFEVTTIPFAPLTGGVVLPLLSTGHNVSAPINLGFNFSFFCNTYHIAYVSSNGFITFSSGAPSGCCSGQFLPNPTNPNNLIACGWNNYNLVSGGTITYSLYGTAPNRICAINYNAVPHNSSFLGGTMTTQVLIYETTNVIEIHTTSMTASATNHTMGLENISGTRAIPVAGRNASVWSAVSDARRFTPINRVARRTIPLIVSWSPTTSMTSSTTLNPRVTPLVNSTYIVNVYDSACRIYDTVNIQMAGRDSGYVTVSICPRDSFRIGAHTYKTTGVYRDTLATIYHCDSIVTTTLTVLPFPTGAQSVGICTGSSYSLNGHTYTSAGIYRDTMRMGGGGCDSIIVTTISISAFVSSTRNYFQCGGSITVNGHVYSATGVYVDTFRRTAPLCDSIITSNLVILTSSTFTQNVRICYGNSFNVGAHRYTSSGSYRDTFANYLTCDSFVTTNLTVDTFPVNLVNARVCNGTPYTFNGHVYVRTGIYADTFRRLSSCDSIVITNLVIDTLPVGHQNLSICTGSSYIINAHAYSIAGTYIDTLARTIVCDSIVETNLSLRPLSYGVQTIVLCSPSTFTVGRHTYSSSGSYRDTFVSYLACDSILTTNLTINPISRTTINVTICYDQFYFVQGANRNISGAYYDTLTNYLFCDSIITTNLTVISLISHTMVVNICRGESYFCQGAAQSSTGNYYDTLVSYRSCDSLLITNLNVYNETYHTRNLNICQRQSFFCGGRLQSTSGTYFDTLSNFHSCDSILTTILTVNRIDSTHSSITICSGDIYGGRPYYTDTLLTNHLTNIFSCDSVVTLSIFINPLPIANAGPDDTICLGSAKLLTATGGVTYRWSSPGSSISTMLVAPIAPTTYTVTVTDINRCSSTDEVTIYTKVITMSFTTVNISCHGKNDGSATVTSTSGLVPYTYQWSDLLAQTTRTATNLYPGVYRVTVTDADLCSGVDTVRITEPDILYGFAVATDAICYGDSNGIANFSATGGTAPYNYRTTTDGINYVSGQIVRNLAAGSYTMEVTDAHGCVAIKEFLISQPPPITMSFTTTEPRCYGYADGSIFVVATGGTPIYNMLLDDGITSSGWFTNLAAGAHHLTITDSKGCTKSYTIGLTQPNPIIVDINPDSLLLELGESGQFFTSFTGAPADSVVFQWTSADGLSCIDCPNPFVSPYTDQIYQVTVIDMSDPSNPKPCTGTAIGYVFVNDGNPIYIPNAFTPNNDGTNDQFQVYGKGLKTVYMQIYDRYGELLFESNHQDEGWDGTYKGAMVQPGVYVYKVVADYLNNKRVEKSGSVTLIH